MPLRVKADLNNHLRGTWQVEFSAAPCSAPHLCCYGFCCPCCFAYQQRNRILDLTGEPYLCCGGVCSCCATPCERRNPWLCCETCCCTSSSILFNRYMIQTRFDIRNDPCDESMLGLIACLNIVANCAQCCSDRETAEHIEHLQHCINAAICSCMLTQQSLELRRIEDELAEAPYQGPPAHIYGVLPPAQQVMVDAQQALRAPLSMPPGQQPLRPGAAPLAACGLVAQGRQIQARHVTVTVPEGVAPGQPIIFITPEGLQAQSIVPQGLGPGQTFPVTY